MEDLKSPLRTLKTFGFFLLYFFLFLPNENTSLSTCIVQLGRHSPCVCMSVIWKSRSVPLVTQRLFNWQIPWRSPTIGWAPTVFLQSTHRVDLFSHLLLTIALGSGYYYRHYFADKVILHGIVDMFGNFWKVLELIHWRTRTWTQIASFYNLFIIPLLSLVGREEAYV